MQIIVNTLDKIVRRLSNDHSDDNESGKRAMTLD